MLLWAALLLGGEATAQPPQDQQFVVIFGTDKSALTPEAQSVVRLIAAQARMRHSSAVAVAGYGDGIGDPAQDAALGKARAAAVRRALEAAGVAPAMLKETPPLPPDKAVGIPVHKVTVTLEP
jgi:outer membrane protein OmpA-like peptidoglycan-associated protein